MSKKKLFFIPLILALIAGGVYAYKIDHDDKVVATVNGEPFYESAMKEKIKQLYSASGINDDFSYDNLDNSMKENLIKTILASNLILQEADKINIENNEQFKLAHKLEIEQLKQKIFLDQKLKNHLTDELLKSEYEIFVNSRKGKKEYKITQILFNDQDEANKIYDLIVADNSFDKVVKDNKNLKIDTTADFVPEEQFPEEFMFLKELSANSYFKPVKTHFGWHLVKLIDVRDSKVPSFEETKDRLRNNLTQRFISQFIDKLLSDNNVKITLEK